MANEGIKCPLCGGLSKISRGELIRALSDKDLATKVQNYVAELVRGDGSSKEPESVGAAARGQDFQTQVHSWNPENPMWRRSNKE
jgi:hypothetical protein